jgi:hypothetical protein
MGKALPNKWLALIRPPATFSPEEKGGALGDRALPPGRLARSLRTAIARPTSVGRIRYLRIREATGAVFDPDERVEKTE